MVANIIAAVTAVILIANGSEDIEVVSIADVLSRGGVILFYE